jgi:large subunit ribosomal protein L13
MKTTFLDTKKITRKWYVVDAKDMILGRLASKTASILIGKGKPAYAPHQDHGDNVIVINAEKVRLSGKKSEMKTYFRHTQFPGGEKIRTVKEQMEHDPTQVIHHAVRGMIPKNVRGRHILRKLHVYAGSEHPHSGQTPTELKLD